VCSSDLEGDAGPKGEQGLKGEPGDSSLGVSKTLEKTIESFQDRLTKIEEANTYIKQLLGEEEQIEDQRPEDRLGGGVANWSRIE